MRSVEKFSVQIQEFHTELRTHMVTTHFCGYSSSAFHGSLHVSAKMKPSACWIMLASLSLGDPCRSQDAFAHHEGCEAWAAHGTSPSLDDGRKDHAPWQKGGDMWWPCEIRSRRSFQRQKIAHLNLKAKNLYLSYNSPSKSGWICTMLQKLMGC